MIMVAMVAIAKSTKKNVIMSPTRNLSEVRHLPGWKGCLNRR